jgi:L-threonylcarbamoyladenylate synthase
MHTSSATLSQAVAHLREGGLVAFPTETVYGLGGDAKNMAAVDRIFAIKGRPTDHPLIVHLPDASHLDVWARDIPPVARRLASALWPGPLTMILKRSQWAADRVTGGQDSIGLRVPAHPLALSLLRAFGGGLAAPSANRFGRISPTCAQDVRAELGSSVLLLDGGPCTVGIESTILDLSGRQPVILRPGMISAKTFAPLLGQVPRRARQHTRTRAPGMLPSHYAPQTPVTLCPRGTLVEKVRCAIDKCQRVVVLSPQPCPSSLHDERILWQCTARDAQTYAHELYAHLRWADTQACSHIFIAHPPKTPMWWPVRDRLLRAAGCAFEGNAS